MLVIISDLHLSDTTLAPTVKPEAFRVFRNRLSDMAYDASWRAEGAYKPVEEITLLLLGDIIDVIRSTAWLHAGRNARPWCYEGDEQDCAKIDRVVEEITGEAIACNTESLGIIKSFADPTSSMEECLTIPKAGADGKPLENARDPLGGRRQRVAVKVYYMIGNHDWVYGLQRPAYNMIRQRIIDAMGLAHPDAGPFPYLPHELRALQDILLGHRVHARHGDHLDAINCHEARNRLGSSVGDAVVIELVAKFVEKSRSIASRKLHSFLKEIDNVRPLTALPVWLEGILRNHATREEESHLRKLWCNLVTEFNKVSIVKQKDTLNPLDPVDKIQIAFKFGAIPPNSITGRLVGLLAPKGESGDEEFTRAALAEPLIRNGVVQYVVYGHTHRPKSVALDIWTDDTGARREQLYFNSGTWRRMWTHAINEPAAGEFALSHVMSFIGFFRDGERKGRPYETWSGTLGWED